MATQAAELGDLVTGVIMGIIGAILWLIGAIGIITKSPDPQVGNDLTMIALILKHAMNVQNVVSNNTRRI